jgi:hypothetical protein
MSDIQTMTRAASLRETDDRGLRFTPLRSHVIDRPKFWEDKAGPALSRIIPKRRLQS